MKAMILAAGLGTRLGELTRDIPKPMLDINGKPLLEYNIRNLVRYGFDEIIINLYFLPEMIREFVGDGSSFGAKVEYSYEDKLLGTAGGVKKVEGFFADDEPFLVIYGDILTDQDLSLPYALHVEKNSLATIIVHERKGSNSIILLEDDNRVSGFFERPSEKERKRYDSLWVNSGIQVLSPEILQRMPAGVYADLPKDIYISLVDEGGLYGLPLTGERVAIDSPERYLQACKMAEKWQLERR